MGAFTAFQNICNNVFHLNTLYLYLCKHFSGSIVAFSPKLVAFNT